MITALPKASRIHYPESDGKPMAETDIHRELMIALIHALQQFYKNDPMAYAAGNMFLYYEEGVPESVCAPDVFLVLGVPKKMRETYRVWEEGKSPDLIIELTSRSTKWEDSGKKKGLYEALGVKEYYLFDPLNHYLNPPFMGFRLEGNRYVPMEPSGGRLKSDVTGLDLGVLNGWLRFFSSVTGQPLMTPAEEAEVREMEAAARQKEAEAREAAEAENRRLAKEVEKLKAELRRLSSERSPHG